MRLVLGLRGPSEGGKGANLSAEMLFPSSCAGTFFPGPGDPSAGMLRAESSAQGGGSWHCCCLRRAGGSCILHIALLRGFLPVGVKVSGEQSQRAEHMVLVRLAARSCYLPRWQPRLHLI